MSNELLTFAEAAKPMGVKTRAGVWIAVKRGLVATEPYGPQRGIRPAEAQRYRQEKRSRGRPPQTR